MKKQLLNILLLLATAGAVKAQVSFAPAVNYGAGTNPSGVFSADFNGDGKMDLATANSGSNTTSVLTGSGSGTFSAAVSYTVAGMPRSIFSADFNNNGNMDLVTGGQAHASAWVQMNNGDGTFAPSTNYLANFGPASVFSADFNNDGKMDLALAAGSIDVLLGNGNGTFAGSVNYTTASGSGSVFSADFNGDGNKDLVTANSGSNNVSVLLGSGTGTFGTAVNYSVGTGPNSVFSADFNGDGKMDLATANYSSNNVSILIGSGTGTFATAINYAVGTRPNSVFSADLNGDGKLDLATANYTNNNVSVLIGSGTGTFATAVNFAVGTGPYSIFSADFNGDGKLDLATANYTNNNVSVLLNNTPAAALNFDGSDDYVNIPNNSSFNFGTNDFTIETYAKTNSTSGNKVMIGKINGGNNYWMGVSNGKAKFSMVGGADASGTSTISDNNWHHIAAVKQNSIISLYVDGILEATQTNSGTATIGANLTLGNFSGGFNFPGSLDEVRIWNRALCKGEILNNKNAELPSSQTGLVAYYNFNQGLSATNNSTVTTLTDLSGNANHGTLYNFTLIGTTSNWVAPGAVTSGSAAPTYTPVSASVSSQTNVSCHGGHNGSATILTSGGTSTYSYVWYPSGGSSATASNLAQGVYTVSVTDANACNTTQTVTIYQPLNTLFVNPLSGNISCNGSSDGLIITNPTGGTSPYTFSWNNGASTADISGLAPGTYSVTVTDANLCTATETLTITEPPALIASISSQTNVNCNGGNNGAATVTANGGTASYSYSWSPSGGTAANASGLSAGVYNLTVTDANACSAQTSLTITQPTVLSATISSQTNVLCNGGNNGTATADVTGGTPNYTYLWSNGSTTQTINNLVAGVHTYTVTDANNCNASETVTITEPTILSATISSQTNVLCNGGNNGTATADVTGGTPNYTYLWSNEATTQTINNLVAGVYTYTVTDANSCNASGTVTITEPANLTATVSSQTNVSCNGGNNGTATADVAGGTPNYTYLWSNGATTQTINNLVAGVYSYTVTDANSCNASETVTITEPATLTATISSQTNVSCYGANNGTATADLAGGTPNYTYLWSNGATTQTINNLVAGVYSYTVTDANSCNASETVTITEPSAFDNTTSTSNLTITSNAAGVTYQWIDCNNANTSISGETNQSFTATANGNYAVVVTNGACSDTSACVAITTVGIKSNTKNASVSIYPNPSSAVFTIVGLATGTTIEIYNAIGEVVLSLTSADTKTKIDLSNKANGVYFVKTNNGYTHKLVKQD